MRKICLIFVIALLFIVLGCSHNEYFFDKDTFQKDHVTYMDYEAYQKPMRLEFEYWYLRDRFRSQEQTKNIFSWDDEEIRFVFDELKKSKRIEENLISVAPRYVWFFVRRMDTENGGEIVLLADVGENKVAEVGEGKYVKITDELWNFLMEVEKRKENIPPENEKNPEPNLEDAESKSN